MQQSGPRESGSAQQDTAHSRGEVDAELPADSANTGAPAEEAAHTQSGSIRGLPLPRNERFTGREDLLVQLRSGLESNGCVVLKDPSADRGGYGKSALAIEYAYRQADDYPVTLWLNASRLAVLAGGYAALAKELSLVTDDSDQPAAIEAVHQWLNTNAGWLLIFDDVGPGCDLQAFYPQPNNGHVILTSRNDLSSDAFKSISVGPLTQEDSIAILTRAGHEDEAQVAAELAVTFGESPAALDMIAAFADASGITLSDAAAQFEQIPNREGEGTASPLDAKTAVRVVLSASLRAAAQKNPVAQNLFAVCAFLGSDPFPLDGFQQGADAFPAELAGVVRESAALNAAVDVLCRFGLARLSEAGFSVDRRVKRAARDGMPRDLRKGCARAALGLVAGGFIVDDDDANTLPECAKRLDHAYSVSMHTHRLETAGKETESLLYTMGLHLMTCEDPASAKQCFALAVELSKSTHGPKSPITALRLNNLATAQQRIGNTQEARANYEEALKITESIFVRRSKVKLDPAYDSIVTATGRHLGPMLVEMDEPGAALEMYGRAMAILVEVYGSNHPLVAECANRIANIWFSRGEWKRARKYFARAVQAEENSLEGIDKRLSSHLINLGSTFLKLDMFEKARKQFDRALDIDLAEYGPDHRSVGRDLDKLGQALSAQKLNGEAEEAYRRALTIHEKAEPPIPEDLSRTLKHLGRTLEAQGNMAKAQPCFEKLIEIDEQLYGVESTHVGKSLAALGHVLEELGDQTRAQECYERALTIETAANGADTERAATTLHRIGRTLEAQEKLDDALHMYERAMSIDMKLNGKQHTSVARDAFAIGCLLAAKKDNIVAMGHLTMALEVYEQTLGKSNTKTRKIRDKIAELGS